MKKVLSSTECFLANLYNRLDSITSVSEKQLSFYRIFFSLVYLFYFRHTYSWIGNVPQAFYFPKHLTITSISPQFPSEIYFIATDYLIIALLVLTTIGFYSRPAFFSLFFITIINNSFAYSLGKIDHYILGSLIFLVFALSNSATYYALKPERKISTHKSILSLFAIMIVFGYFSAGFQKAYHWIDLNLSTSGTLRWVYDIHFTSTTKPLLSDFILNVHPIILEGMDYFGVFFEISGIFFLLYSRLSWKAYLLLATLFHLANTLILNIPFSFHFPVFGIWILSSVLHTHKPLIIPFAFAWLFKGTYFHLYLWFWTLGVACYGLFKEPDHNE